MQTKQEPTQYDKCGEEIEEMARELIRTDHTDLISNCKVCYLWKNKEITKKGQNVGATAEKCSAKMKALTDYDFIITLSYPTWQELSDVARQALLDHELEHLFCDENDEGEMKCKILPHDTEEFNSIIERHGLWREELKKIAQSIKKAEKKDVS